MVNHIGLAETLSALAAAVLFLYSSAHADPIYQTDILYGVAGFGPGDILGASLDLRAGALDYSDTYFQQGPGYNYKVNSSLFAEVRDGVELGFKANIGVEAISTAPDTAGAAHAGDHENHELSAACCKGIGVGAD